MKKKEILLIAIVIVLAIGTLIGLKIAGDRQHNKVLGTPEGVTMDFISGISTACAEEDTAAEDRAFTEALVQAGIARADSYLIVSINEYFYPVPLTEENDGRSFRVSQGEDKWNEITLGKDSFYMSDASCPDHICIYEGEVTLENRDQRILAGYVYCLPNQVTLQLVSYEEFKQMMKDAGFLKSAR